MLKSIGKKEYAPLINYFESFLSNSRIETLHRVLNKRTRYITVVLENIYQPHNASAVLRSCEGFGIQDVHIIENENQFEVSKGVTIGADKWITKKNYRGLPGNENTLACLDNLKSRGYSIVATTPHENDVEISDFEINSKTALLFGTELEGLTDEALSKADAYVKIPMYGFSESYNISVSAAICLAIISKKLRAGSINWQLSKAEKQELYLEWVMKSVNRPDQLLKYYWKKQKAD